MTGITSHDVAVSARGTLKRDGAGVFCLQVPQATDLLVPVAEILEDYLGEQVTVDLFGTAFHGVLSGGAMGQFYLLTGAGAINTAIYAPLERALGRHVAITLRIPGGNPPGAGTTTRHVLAVSEVEVLASGLIHHVDLFTQGDAGYHTFRIPGLLACPGNVVLAFAEARKNSGSDFGEIHCAMRRSEDGGITWGPVTIIWQAGSLAVQNPCPVLVPGTGEILLPLIVDRKHPHVMRSKDLGKTWTDAIPLANLDVEAWAVNGPCPGHGIRLRTGRLLACCHHNVGERFEGGRHVAAGTWYTHVIYSDDDGETWNRGHVFPTLTNEAMAAELDDGRVIAVLRQNHETASPGKVMVSCSDDGGLTFSPPRESDELSGPVCQASIINAGNNQLLFSNPDSTSREKLTIRLSTDGGRSWPVKRVLYHGMAAYSDMAVLGDGTVACALECGEVTPTQRITLALFNVAWMKQQP